VTTTVNPATSEVQLKKRKRRELIEKLSCTLVGVMGILTIQYQTWTLLRKVKISEQTQQELQSIAIAAQKFHSEHKRWPRDMFELRNDPKIPFIPRRDPWGRAYIYTPPKERLIGRVETYGEDGLASGRKDDGDAAYEFNTETAHPGEPLPTSSITYLNCRSCSTN
jgi:hypothetical protein